MTFLTVLEFLSQKGNVIHGDISINNILINRVWDCSLEDSPARLRLLASNINASTNDPGPNDEHGQDADDREDNSQYFTLPPPFLVDSTDSLWIPCGFPVDSTGNPHKT